MSCHGFDFYMHRPYLEALHCFPELCLHCQIKKDLVSNPSPSDRDRVYVYAVKQQPPAGQGCLADSCLEKSRPEPGAQRTIKLCGQSVIKLAPWPCFI